MSKSNNSEEVKNSDKKEEINNSTEKDELESKNQVEETEETRERLPGEERKGDYSAEKKKKIKMPFFIKVLNILHFGLITSFMFIAIHFYFRYATIKDDEFQISESNTQMGRVIICVILAVFFAISRAFLVDGFES